MTVIFFLPGQSQCSLLNYSGVHTAGLQDLLQYWQPFSWQCGDGKRDNSDYAPLAAEV